jgi:D-alanyl-D-alanine dipeptidase
MKQKQIPPADLQAFDDFTATQPIAVDLVYAQPEHRDNIFGCALYRGDAKLWGHKDIVALTLLAAQICHKEYGWILEIKDSLRPVEAQAAMQETAIVRANPHWMEEPRLLSPPGHGGHPRGMAIDLLPLTENGEEIDMGTRFDHLSEDRSNNPAARDYTAFSEDEAYNNLILENRRKLTDAMLDAAAQNGMELLPLPQEWWDFRFYPAYTKSFLPLFDADLPEEMQMMLHGDGRVYSERTYL